MEILSESRLEESQEEGGPIQVSLSGAGQPMDVEASWVRGWGGTADEQDRGRLALEPLTSRTSGRAPVMHLCSHALQNLQGGDTSTSVGSDHGLVLRLPSVTSPSHQMVLTGLGTPGTCLLGFSGSFVRIHLHEELHDASQPGVARPSLPRPRSWGPGPDAASRHRHLEPRVHHRRETRLGTCGATSQGAGNPDHRKVTVRTGPSSHQLSAATSQNEHCLLQGVMHNA